MDDKLRMFTRRLRLALFKSYFLSFAGVWLFAWGFLVLLGRSAAGLERQYLMLGGVGALVAAMLAYDRARRRLPDTVATTALLDLRGACGGMFMAAAETRLGDWEARTPRPPELVAVCRGGRRWLVAAAGLAFVALSMAIPERYIGAAGGGRLLAESHIRQLAGQIEVLVEEGIVEEEQAEELWQGLEAARGDAAAETAARMWEAFDHLEAKLARLAAEAAEDSAAEMAKLAEIAAMAEALANSQRHDTPNLDPALAAQAFERLAKQLQEATANNQELRELFESLAIDSKTWNELAETLRKLDGDAPPQLTREQIEQLKKMAEGCEGGTCGIQNQLSRLAEAGMLSQDKIGKLMGGGEKMDSAQLLEFLSGLDGGGDLEAAMGSLAESGMLVRGPPGISKNGGPAPMFLGEESREDGLGFEEIILPPAQFGSVEGSELMGVSLGAPDDEEKFDPSRSARMDKAASGGGSAATHAILPRHRPVVGRYFDR